jgi:hypothetical protein
MAMVCPQCKGSFEQALQCPSCGVRLLYQSRIRTAGGPGLPAEDGQWQHTPWGRMLIGVLLAQGLAYGLQQFLTAGLLATGEGQATIWATLMGLLLLQGLQGLGVLIGGALTGAGQRRGLFFGAMLGLANGFVFLLIQRSGGGSVTEVDLYGQPLTHVAFGALGGLIGSLIWKPLPTLAVPGPAESKPKSPVPRGPFIPALAGPVAWVRVVVGSVIVIAGVFWPTLILSLVMQASQGQLSLDSRLQAQLLTWEIMGLFTLVGSGLAGATTSNGLKQGLCVGLTASIVLIGHRLGSGFIDVEQTAGVVVSILALTVAGGWFGGQLFPQVAPRRPRLRA